MENNANSDCHVTTSTQPQINKTLISFNYETPNQQNPETLISPNDETPNQQDPETLISPNNETPNQQNPETLISPNNETPKQQDPVTLIAFNNETPKQQDPVTLISFNNETAKQQDPVTLIAFPKQQDPGTLISFNNETPKQQDPVTLIAFNNETPKQQIPDSPISEPEEDADQPSAKKLKPLNDLAALTEAETTPVQATPNGTTQPSKKSKKKNINSVWTKPTSRKGKKKNKNNNNSTPNDTVNQQTVAITPVLRIPDKTDDTPDMKICLSKVYKAEKVELSDDRMSAGSTKGYRMVRATRGVVDGAWYFEIRVVKLGETGHTRLGWSNEKGDLQAPVGYDANSFGYRDIDGSKVHKALREKYGDEGYKEGDVLGFYINLPVGSLYAQKPPKMVLFKGQRYVCTPDEKDDPPKVVPGSEISFFKNGICQGVAFQELIGGCYYPVASMYTLPNQPHCVVKFNFGPEFEYFPEDFGGRPLPRPMAEVPYHTFDGRVENGNHSWVSQSTRMFPVPRFVKDQVNAVADITKTF